MTFGPAGVSITLPGLRSRFAYKGIYALILAEGARDWRFDKALDKTQYSALEVDIHHVFPQKWCRDKGIDDERRESIGNKTPLAAKTNRTIGGVAPSKYLAVLQKDTKLTAPVLDSIVATHLIAPATLRTDDFDVYFARRRDALVRLVEKATGKSVQRDIEEGHPEETADQFDATDTAVIPDQDPDTTPLSGQATSQLRGLVTRVPASLADHLRMSLSALGRTLASLCAAR
jgi:hypothetical protein